MNYYFLYTLYIIKDLEYYKDKQNRIELKNEQPPIVILTDHDRSLSIVSLVVIRHRLWLERHLVSTRHTMATLHVED